MSNFVINTFKLRLSYWLIAAAMIETLGVSICFLSAIPSANSQSTDVRFQRITLETGLPNGEVVDMVQDKQGFMWLGTAAGVFRYDSYQLTPLIALLRSPKIAEKMINRPLSLCMDAKKRWWSGSDWAGVSVYDPALDSIQVYTKPDGISKTGLCDNNISRLFPDKQGRIWIGTNLGLSVFNTVTESFWERKAHLLEVFEQCRIYDIAQDNAGNVWVATDKRGLWRFEPHNPQPQQIWPKQTGPEAYKGSALVTSLDCDDQGQLWFSTDNSLWVFKKNDPNPQKMYASVLKTTDGSMGILDILNDHRGHIWLGTYHQGAFAIDKNSGQSSHFKKETNNPFSLLNNQIIRLAEDNLGNIWLSCRGEGICILPSAYGRFRQFKHPDTEVDPRVCDVNCAIDGTVYAATSNALMVLRPPYQTMELKTLKSLGIRGALNKVTTTKKGDIWLGTTSGIWQLPANKKSAQKVFSLKETTHVPFMAFQVVNDTTLNFDILDNSSADKLYTLHLKKFNITSISIQGQPYGNKVLCIQPDPVSGGLWIGTYQGLLRLKPQKPRQSWAYFPGYYNNGSDATLTVLADRKYVWWGRTDGGGLNVKRLSDGAYNYYLKEDGLAESSITTILKDNLHRLWLGTSWGISCFQQPREIKNKAALEVFNFNEVDGIGTNLITSGASTASGNFLFFGTNLGLTVVRAADVGGLSDTKLAFTDLLLFDRRVIPGDSIGVLEKDIDLTYRIRLSPKQDFIRITFSAFNFYDPSQSVYAYRLKGISDDWVNIGNRNEVSFTRLSAGSYVLEVKAKGKNSRWSAIRTLEIKKLPHLWQRWQFTMGILLCFVLVGYAIYRWRIRQILKVQSVRQAIAADLHDDIGSALNNIEILSLLGKKEEKQNAKQLSILEKIREEARRSKDAMHIIVWSLDDTNDHLEQLAAKMRRMAAEALEPAGIGIYFPEGEDVKLHLSPEQRRDLLLAYKETITNVCKHAEATQVRIALFTQGRKIILTVTDNGKGMHNPKVVLCGNGLRNIQQRVERWGGNLRLSSPDEGGFSLNMEWPSSNDTPPYR